MSNAERLFGPSVPTASGGPAKQLIVLLHGVGSDGNDLIALAPVISQLLPDAAFVAPNGPLPCDFAPFGYQWYSIQDPDPDARLAQIRKSAGVIDRFLDDELAKRGLADKDLALVGFSQGTMMSLYVAPRRKSACAGVLGYSGRLDSPELLEKEITARPPVMLIHGSDDDRLPVALMKDAADALARNGIAASTHVCPGLGHGIDEAGLVVGTRFLAGAFGQD